jgi:hypothetical protein
VDDVPAVEGIELERALPGRAGAWRGSVGGEPVDVTVLALPATATPAMRRSALAALMPLVGPGSGPLPRCRSALLCERGVALVADPVDGRRLLELPPLTTGHAVTVGRAVAQALSFLHHRGLSWGGRLEEVLVDDTGAVRLPYDDAVGRRVSGHQIRGAVAGRADVTALARLLARRCIDPRVAALAAHPPADAAMLARRLRRIARARPLLLAPPEVSSRLMPPASRGRRRAGWAMAGVLALLVAGAAGWVSAADPGSGGGGGQQAQPLAAPVDWTSVVSGLDTVRARALVGAAPLAAADATGSPAFALDAATVRALAARDVQVQVPVPMLRSVVARTVAATFVTLSVTDSLAAYDYRDRSGRVVQTVPARGPRTWTLTLRRMAGGWRLAAVS